MSTVPCKYCGKPTDMTGTKLCDPCWHVVRAVEGDPALARQVLEEVYAAKEAPPIDETRHEIALDISPPLPEGKALIIVVRGREMFHRVIDREDAKIIEPLLTGVCA